MPNTAPSSLVANLDESSYKALLSMFVEAHSLAELPATKTHLTLKTALAVLDGTLVIKNFSQLIEAPFNFEQLLKLGCSALYAEVYLRAVNYLQNKL